jgi:hypothetical protein
MTRNAASAWPEGDVVTVVCPWCGTSTESSLRYVKKHGEASRLDQCLECTRDIIVEATAQGVAVSCGIDVSRSHQ